MKNKSLQCQKPIYQLFGIVIATIFSMTLGLQSANAEPITMDIHKSKEPGPGFGTEKIGTLTLLMPIITP